MSTSIAIQLLAYCIAVVVFVATTRSQLTSLKELTKSQLTEISNVLHSHEDREMVAIRDIGDSFSKFNDKNDRAHGELHDKVNALSAIVASINGKIGNGRIP